MTVMSVSAFGDVKVCWVLGAGCLAGRRSDHPHAPVAPLAAEYTSSSRSAGRAAHSTVDHPPEDPSMPEVTHWLPGSILPTIVAALAAFMLGALWYSPMLFAKAWVAAHGYTEADVKAMQAN